MTGVRRLRPPPGPPARVALRAVVALLGPALACVPVPSPPGPDRGTMAGAAPCADAAGAGSERARLLGPFLAGYWSPLPLPPQGAPPPDFAPAARSLDPAACGACHPQQHVQWKGSLHANAWSPGFAGQLLEGPLAAPAEVRACQACHAPLAEQQPWDAAGAPQPGFDPTLRAQGLVCAGCHVRAHRRFGPPRRVGLPPPAGPLPHGGFEARPEFEQSRFCAECHQFFDTAGVNGKPVQNTFAEWRASPQAAAGRTCQSCHMPDRAHRWRGIHHPETVRAAVGVALTEPRREGDALVATLRVTNRDVGHAFPTYVTPRVWMAVWQEDGAGRELPGSRREAAIGREIDFARRREVFDTRVLPGESARLDYAAPRHPRAAVLVGRVTVDPDHHYRDLFAGLLESYADPGARRRIGEALRRTRSSRYVLRELRRPLAAAGAPSA